jgi:hypothetical protein
VRALAISLSQVAVMSAIVACLLYLPVGMVLALVFALFGFTLEDMITFDGTFSISSGLFAWWLLTFGGACLYAVRGLPWDEKALAWPRKK